MIRVILIVLLQTDHPKQAKIYSQNILFLPMGTNVAVQGEDGGLWMYVMIMCNGTDDHSGICYRVRVTKSAHAITRMKGHIKPTNILAEDYLQNETVKANQTLAADRLNEFFHHFTQP